MFNYICLKRHFGCIVPDGRREAKPIHDGCGAMERLGQKIDVKNTALALMHEGKCYLVRLDDERLVDLLRKVYLFVSTVEFPARTIEVMEQAVFVDFASPISTCSRDNLFRLHG